MHWWSDWTWWGGGHHCTGAVVTGGVGGEAVCVAWWRAARWWPCSFSAGPGWRGRWRVGVGEERLKGEPGWPRLQLKAMFRWPPLVVRLREESSPRDHWVMNSLREAMKNWELSLDNLVSFDLMYTPQARVKSHKSISSHSSRNYSLILPWKSFHF